MIPRKKNPEEPPSEEEYPMYIVESADTDFWHLAFDEDEALRVASAYLDYSKLEGTRYDREHDVSIFKLTSDYDFRFDDEAHQPGEGRITFRGSSFEDFYNNWDGSVRSSLQITYP